MWSDDKVVGLLVLMMVVIPFVIVCLVMFFITWWKIFEKGGENGWAIFVPFYNSYIEGKVAGSVKLGIANLIVAIISLFARIIAAIIYAVTNSGMADLLILFYSHLPLLVMSFILAFKLGGKFGRGVWFRVLLTVPLINAFPHLYLALSKNCVYSEKPKEASVGLFMAILMMPLMLVILGILVAVAVPRFVATRTDVQVATARSDLASAMKAVVAKVFADNIDTTQSKAPDPNKSVQSQNGNFNKEWGDWIIEVAGLDGARWERGGNAINTPMLVEQNAGIQPIGNVQTTSGGKKGGCGMVLGINTSDGIMLFAPNNIGGENVKVKKATNFCWSLKKSYESSGGPGNKLIPLASAGTVEF